MSLPTGFIIHNLVSICNSHFYHILENSLYDWDNFHKSGSYDRRIGSVSVFRPWLWRCLHLGSHRSSRKSFTFFKNFLIFLQWPCETARRCPIDRSFIGFCKPFVSSRTPSSLGIVVIDPSRTLRLRKSCLPSPLPRPQFHEPKSLAPHGTVGIAFTRPVIVRHHDVAREPFSSRAIFTTLMLLTFQ